MKNHLQLREGEEIVASADKHIFVYLVIFLKIMLFGVVAAVAIFYLIDFVFDSQNFIETIAILLTFYLAGIWLWGFARWIDEDFDSIILTNERIININQEGLFKVDIASTSLVEIQDVRGVITGFFGNIFDFGDLEIETAAHILNFQMTFVRDPNTIAHKILNEKKTLMLARAQTNPPTPPPPQNPPAAVNSPA